MGLGKISINTIKLAINQDLRALFVSKYINIHYFIYYYQGLSIVGSGMTVKGITIDELNNLFFPLPPLAEQQRIVAKIDELITLCEQLKNIDPDSALPLPDMQQLLPPLEIPPSSELEEQYAMAARGDVSTTETKEHRQAIEDLFGDGADG
jgi:type I restriction enzyme S subunit